MTEAARSCKRNSRASQRRQFVPDCSKGVLAVEGIDVIAEAGGNAHAGDDDALLGVASRGRLHLDGYCNMEGK